MNVEQSYVKTNKRESIVQIVERRLNTDPEDTVFYIPPLLQHTVIPMYKPDTASTTSPYYAGKTQLIHSFSEEDDEIEDLIEKKLDEKGINQRICMFREVVRDKKWVVES